MQETSETKIFFIYTVHKKEMLQTGEGIDCVILVKLVKNDTVIIMTTKLVGKQTALAH